MFARELLLLAASFALLALGCSAYDWIEDIGDDYATNSSISETLYEVPDGFLIGLGSAAFQIEGGWNADGKGQSIWDNFLHIWSAYYDNGDVACDSYHRWEEDVKLVKDMKLDTYRFSLSWPRLLPNGTTDYVNHVAVAYYNSLIDTLLNNSITPVVTLYHWDLPLVLQNLGGWTKNDSTIQEYFVDYARFAFSTFGDRVQWWTTFNEPYMFCSYGYELGKWAPGIAKSGFGGYACGHNVLLAHAKTYDMYYNDFSDQGGQLGITMDFLYYVPKNTSSSEDQAAANRGMIFHYGWFADPLVTGDYPTLMREVIDANSASEGFNMSRLPTFNDTEQELLEGSTDFLGINHYYTFAATYGVDDCDDDPSMDRDLYIVASSNSSWGSITPWGIRGALNWVMDRYGNYPTYLTENGCSTTTATGLKDYSRITYFSGFMRATMRAVNEDGVNLYGYTGWSLMDNLEWTSGYGTRYGVCFVDFDSTNRTRTPKKSASFFKSVMTKGKVSYYNYDDL